MGYFINPVKFDDRENVNVFADLNCSQDAVINGKEKIAEFIASKYDKGLLLIDGYMTVDIEAFTNLIVARTSADKVINVNTLFKTNYEIKELVADSLPENRDYDPRLIYGKLYPGNVSDFFDEEKLNNFLKNLDSGKKMILFGNGCLSEEFIDQAAMKVFIDMTPKDTAIRINGNKYQNIGSNEDLGFDATARRAYFVDVELVTKLRRDAIANENIDYYLLENFQEEFTYISKPLLKQIMDKASQRPIRPKPLYIEGVWGGQFIKKLRHIPDELAEKVSWAFELIATEASVAFQIGSHYLDIPFLTIMDHVGRGIIGEEHYERFNGYFPIRFNFDDTWHSDGNMSIQCHPNDEMAHRIHGDYAGQCEAYYVVITGHDARTYLGFKAGADGREFLQRCSQSESTGEMLPYRDYINGLKSKPGLQVFIPAGTVHSSGRNQLVLELGSLTVNAYTYKIYDYNRQGLDGRPRPIHTKFAEETLVFSRDEDWVRENIAFDPILLDDQEEYQEYLVGKHESMYFETHRINLQNGGTYRAENDKGFCVLTVVDGEHVDIWSEENPDYRYSAKYLDVVVIPASIKNYIVEAKGKQPVVLHKAFVRI